MVKNVMGPLNVTIIFYFHTLSLFLPICLLKLNSYIITLKILVERLLNKDRGQNGIELAVAELNAPNKILRIK